MNQRGFLYVMSLGVVVFLTIAGASILMRGLSETNVSERERNQAVAFQLADAAVDQASMNLRTPADTSDDVNAGTFPRGSYTIDSPPTSLGGSMWEVTTHGTSAADPAKPRHIDAVFQLTPKSVFQFALFGQQNINVSGSAITDSYDSRNGPYNTTPGPGYNADHNGDIGTNATAPGGVTVGGSIFIDGQVAVGPNVADPTSVVTGYDPAFITGGTSPPSNNQDVVSQDSPFPMPPVTVPLGLTCVDHTVTGSTTETLAPGTYCYHDLTIQGNAILTATGAVTIYLTGELTAKGNSVVGVVNDPRLMQIRMTPTSVATLQEGTITGSNEFYGSIYGPEATFTITGNADVYGSIIAKTVNLTGSATIHYDEGLTTVTDITNSYQTTLLSWRERTDL